MVPATPAGMSVKTFMASMMQTVVSGRTAEPTETNGGRVGRAGGVEGADHRALDHHARRGAAGGGRRGPGRPARGRRRAAAAARGAAAGERRGGGLGPSAAEPDLGRALDEVDRRQVVPLHQADEVADRPDVEGLGRFRRVLRHACTPRSTVVGAARPVGRRAAVRGARRRRSGQRDPDRVERLGDVGQDLAAVGGHEHVVLDPDAAPVGQVDPRLDRDDHARPGAWPSVVRRKQRGLVDLQAEPVAQAVVKKRPKPASSITERASASTSRAVTPGPDRGDPALLGRQDGPVDLLELGSDLTGDQDPRQVTFVGPAGRPPVDQDEVGVADPRLGRRPGVRQGRPRADGDDRREARRRGPAPPEVALQGVGRVLLRVARAAAPARSIAKARSAWPIASRIASISPSVLDRPERLDPARPRRPTRRSAPSP